MAVERQPRIGYDRNRGKRALDHYREGESSEESCAADEIISNQEDFASKMRNYLSDNGDPRSLMRRLLENIGKYTRAIGKEAPRMDYLDVQLHFDEIVEDNRRCEALMDGEGVTFVTYSEDEWRELGQKRGKF